MKTGIFWYNAPTDNNPLVQMMAWHRTNNGLRRWRIYSRPQWVNLKWGAEVYTHTSDSLLKIQNLTERAKIAVAQS